MPKFSANLGFLWTEHSLPQAIRIAAKAGFKAVECHWPYAVPVEEVNAALKETGLPMLGLNTVRAGEGPGRFGYSALPDMRAEARAAIDQAIEYGAQIGCQNVHVMAGAAPQTLDSRNAFVANLIYAADRAAKMNMSVLIEPINPRDMPGYYLQTADAAAEIIKEAGRPNIKMMFDCYHIQITQGDILKRIEKHLAVIGHIQFAAVPSRAEPDEGELAYDRIFSALDQLGYQGWVGAEYKPRGKTDDGLGWFAAYRA